MDCDRRTVVAGLIVAGTLPGCAKASSPPRPRSGLIGDRFLAPEGRIIDTGNGGISHSEGQGFAMVVAEAANDRATFDLLWNWTQRTLARPDHLFSWRYDPRVSPAVSDPNNATDGDILIAWALARAAARWRATAYADASARIRGAIRQHLFRAAGGARTMLLPALNGFAGAAITVNPSYYVWPALDAFRRLDGTAAWGPLIRDGERLMADSRFGPSQLPTDWVDIDSTGAIGPARGRPARFGFDAVRVPLYLSWSGRFAALAPFQRFWQGFVARNQPIPAWIDVVDGSQAPYALSRGGQQIVDLTLRRNANWGGAVPGEDYYSTALADLASVARRGGR